MADLWIRFFISFAFYLFILLYIQLIRERYKNKRRQIWKNGLMEKWGQPVELWGWLVDGGRSKINDLQTYAQESMKNLRSLCLPWWEWPDISCFFVMCNTGRRGEAELCRWRTGRCEVGGGRTVIRGLIAAAWQKHKLVRSGNWGAGLAFEGRQPVCQGF